MNSFTTLDAARAHAAQHPEATHIIEIDPGQPGIGRYICARTDATNLRRSLARKPMAEIKAVIGDAIDLMAEQWAARDAAIHAAIPGLDALRAARADEGRYQEEFNRMMDDEYNDGARPPKPVQVASTDVATQYPIAAAYLRAEAWERSGHYAKSATGRRAMARLEAKESYQQVLADMEAEWDAHVQAHVWD